MQYVVIRYNGDVEVGRSSAFDTRAEAGEEAQASIDEGFCDNVLISHMIGDVEVMCSNFNS